MSVVRTSIATAAALAAVLVGLAMLGLGLVLTTAVGARWMIAAADAGLPARISVVTVEGSLWRGLRLGGVRYEDGAGLTAVLERLQIAAVWSEIRRGRLVLERLAIGGGSVRLAPAAEGQPPQAPSLPRIPEQIGVRALSITGVTVAGRGADVTVRRLAAVLDGPRLVIDTLEASVAGVELTAAGRLGIDDALEGAVDAVLELPAELGAEPERVLLTGTFAFEAAESWRGRAQWTRLRWEGSGAGTVTSARGNAVIDLGASVTQIDLDAELEADLVPGTLTLEADAILDGDALVVDAARIAVLGGLIRVNGEADLAAMSGEARVSFEGLDPSLVDERLEGTLGGQMDASFTSEGGLGATVTGSIGGELGGRALAGRLDLRYAGDRLAVDAAQVELDEGRLELSGTLAPSTADLRFAANVPRIANWYPPASGALTASGRIMGATDDPSIEISFEGRDLVLEDSGLPRLDQLTLAAAGTRARHTLEVEASSDVGRAALRTRQGVSDGIVAGTVEASTLTLERGGTWLLAAPARFTVGPDVRELERACYTGPAAGRLCAALGNDTLAVEARSLPGSLAEPWLPEGFLLAGNADADIDFDFGAAPRGTFEIEIPVLEVRSEALPEQDDGGSTVEPGARDAPGPATPLELARIADLTLRGALDEQRFGATLGATLAATGDRIDGAVELVPPTAQGELTATLTANVADLGVLDALVEEVEGLVGGADVRFSAAGTLAAPRLQGSLEVHSLGGRLPALGIELDGSSFAAAARGPDAIDLRGELCSAGCVGMSGTLTLPREASDWMLDARIRGEGFVLAALPEIGATVSPDVEVAARPALWAVTGTIAVDEGLMRIEDVPRGAVRPATETVVHGRPEAQAEDAGGLPASIMLDIAAELGDVRFEGLGLAAQLGGMLDVEQTSDGRLLVQGTTSIEEGSFRAYGQELTIERGQVIFTGSPDNPSLDIRAVREVEGGVVGIAMTGTARDPRSVVFSDPAVSESEALALLVTGRSLESAGPADAAALERAALGLGLRRALPALSRVGDNLGLDELGVGTSGDAQGALVAGKQLGEDVYLRYKHGLFDDFAGLELIYRITERFRLRTETGTSQSIDLIYDVSRGEPDTLEEQVGEGLPGGDEAATPEDIAAPSN